MSATAIYLRIQILQRYTYNYITLLFDDTVVVTLASLFSMPYNLVPRVLSLLRESTLGAAGHVPMHAKLNPSRTEDGSST